MIIICPSCSAQYDLPAKAIGDSGRKVQCAKCQTHWRAFPEVEEIEVPAQPAPPPPSAVAAGGGRAQVARREIEVEETTASLSDFADVADLDFDDALFDEKQEKQLDAEFEAESADAADADSDAASENASVDAYETNSTSDGGTSVPGAAPKRPLGPVPSTNESEENSEQLARRQEALQKRHAVLARNLPRQRMQRWVRFATGTLLLVVVLCSFIFRESFVRSYPELADLYGLVGIEVNVIGLDIENVQTVRALRDGVETLRIEAELANTSGHLVAVPRVHIELKDADSVLLYEWNATPQVSILRPKERIEFSTELSMPPSEAVEIKIGFVESDVTTALEGG